MDQNLRDLRIEHIKRRGDQALREGNSKTAYTRYTEALALKPDRELARRLLSNRSLAFSAASRYLEALADADAAVSLAPSWDKAHYRRGSALLGLKHHSEAALAFRNAWKLDAGNQDAVRMIRMAVRSMTRQEVADGILAILGNLESRGDLGPPVAEAARQVELDEAAFSCVRNAARAMSREKPYHDQYVRWIREGPSPGEAYTQRAAVYNASKCFLQGRADARQAVEWYAQRAAASVPGSLASIEAGCAHLRLGQALLAEPDHANRQPMEAAKAFARGLAVDPHNPDLKEGSKEARQLLSLEQLQQVQDTLSGEGCDSLGPAKASVIKFEVEVEFSVAEPKHFKGEARRSLIAALATALGPGARPLEVESVWRLDPGLVVGMSGAAAGGREEVAAQIAALQGFTTFGSDLDAMLGSGRVLKAAILDDRSKAHDMAAGTGSPAMTARQSRDLVKIPRPKMQLALPYESYSLVTAAGRPVERVDKHPFCMSRVYYDRRELPASAWAQDAAGTYRWRQTASEISVIALQVPSSYGPKQLIVTLEPFRVRVAPAGGGPAFLEGALERGIVPEESTWMLGGGTGDDGCLLLLQKMNLELLQRHWLHSETWWPRLFASGPEIAWDDYEKDYSDLPAAVMSEHAALEAERETTRRIEAAQKAEADGTEAKKEAQRRQQLEKLQASKPSSFREWVDLQHKIAACS